MDCGDQDVRIMAQPKADIAELPVMIFHWQERSARISCRFLKEGLRLPKPVRDMDMEAVSNELMLQIRRRTMEIKRELNMSVLSGHARIMSSNTCTQATMS